MKYLLFTIFAFARIVAAVTGQLMARGTVIQLPLLSSFICCVCCNKCTQRTLEEDEAEEKSNKLDNKNKVSLMTLRRER